MPVSGTGREGEPWGGDAEDWGCGGGGGVCWRGEEVVAGLPIDAPGGGFAALRRYSEILSAYASFSEDTDS